MFVALRTLWWQLGPGNPYKSFPDFCRDQYEGSDKGKGQNMTLTKVHIDIMEHALNRAPNGYFCGDSPAMQELVADGLMAYAGRKSFVPDPYFTLTRKGREALSQNGKVKI